MTAFDKAWGVVKGKNCWPEDDCDWEESERGDTLILTCKKCGAVDEINTKTKQRKNVSKAFRTGRGVVKAHRCEVRIDEDCTGKADRIVTGLEQRVYACGPCSDHAPGNATVERVGN